MKERWQMKMEQLRYHGTNMHACITREQKLELKYEIDTNEKVVALASMR